MKRVGAAVLLLAAMLSGATPTGAAPTPAPAPTPAFAPSRAAVALYRMPLTPPTGGTETLTVDPLGNVWFDEHYEEAGEGGEPRFPGRIVRMSRAGEIVPVVNRTGADDFAVGPDGSVWYLRFRGITRIAPDGSLTSFPMPAEETGGPTGLYSTIAEWSLVVAPDGNVWFGGHRHPLDQEGREVGSEAIIGRLTPAGALSEFVLPGGGGHPTRLAVGPEGNVWFTAAEANAVGFVTAAGQIQEFPLTREASPNFIAGGTGGVWFTEREGSLLARITPSGAVTAFQIFGEKEPGVGPLMAGSDGRIWFAAGKGLIGRIGPGGRLSKVQLPQQTWVEDLAPGPDGSLWYASLGDPACSPGDVNCAEGRYKAGIIGRVDPAPLAVQLDGAELVARAHRVKVRLTCLDGRANSICKGRLRLRAGRMPVAGGRYALGVDRAHSISLRLGDEAREKLLRRGRLRVRCTATLAGGRAEVRALRLRLRTHRQAAAS